MIHLNLMAVIQELANQHATLRLMLGHGDWADDAYYEFKPSRTT